MRKILLVLLVFWCIPSFAANGDIVKAVICGTDSAGDLRIDGSVIELQVSGVTSNGTYTGLPYGTNPTGSPITVSLTSSGDDATGTQTTYTRTLYASRPIRQPYPNQGSFDEIPAGSNGCDGIAVPASTTALRFALAGDGVGSPHGYVYFGDTAITVTAAANFYSQGGVQNNAVSGLSVTNSSALLYSTNKVIANWTVPNKKRITGSTFTVGVVAASANAWRGSEVPAVKILAADTHTGSKSTIVTAPTVDTLETAALPTCTSSSQTSCNPPIYSYQATFNSSDFTDGDTITFNFVAYTWIGTALTRMDTTDGANSQPTPLYAPITMYLDLNGARESSIAVHASGGNNLTCTANAYGDFSGTACSTLNQAMVKIAARNNGLSGGANDVSGSICIDGGTFQWLGGNTAISGTVGRTWVDIIPCSGTPKASAIIDRNPDTGLQAAGGTDVRLSGITITLTGGAISTFDAPNRNWWWDNVTMSGGGSMTAAIYRGKLQYATGITMAGFGPSGQPGLRPFDSTGPDLALARGNDFNFCNSAAGRTCALIYTMLGNTNSFTTTTTAANSLSFFSDISGLTFRTVSTQPFLGFNKFGNLKTSGAGLSAIGIFGATSSPIGAAVIQNLFENIAAQCTDTQVSIASDGTTNTPVNNVRLAYNIEAGCRVNLAYNDRNESTARYRRGWTEVGNIWAGNRAIKTDTFNAPPNGGRIGDWNEVYNVGRYGTYDPDATGGSTGWNGADKNFRSECFYGFYSAGPPITCGSTNPPTDAGTAISTLTGYFTSWGAYNGSAAGAGNGDYKPTSRNPAYSLMPVRTLPYDLAGVARNTANGSAGPYEGNPPPANTGSAPTLTLTGVGH